MFDFDKWPLPIQWLLGLGALLGSYFAARFGTKYAREHQSDDPRAQAREDERVRVALAARDAESKLRADFTIDLNAAQKNFTDQLSNTRREFFAKFDQMTQANHDGCAKLEASIREMERSLIELTTEFRMTRRQLK